MEKKINQLYGIRISTARGQAKIRLVSERLMKCRKSNRAGPVVGLEELFALVVTERCESNAELVVVPGSDTSAFLPAIHRDMSDVRIAWAGK